MYLITHHLFTCTVMILLLNCLFDLIYEEYYDYDKEVLDRGCKEKHIFAVCAAESLLTLQNKAGF